MTLSDATQVRGDIDPSRIATFPPNFQWGVATSSYQIEGAADEDGRSPSIWDIFATKPGAVYQGQNGDVAADHYHHMREDVELMARLGIRSYRFSIAWPRVIPTGVGAINPPGLVFYSQLVDALLEHGIVPMATLYHWDLPQVLQEQGGWLSRNTAIAFADYAEAVVGHLGDRVKHWITINEPFCISYLGHMDGKHAPGIHDPQAAVIAAHHVLLGHGLALQRMRALAPDAQIGITLDFCPIYAADDLPETQQAVASMDTFRNRWFVEPVYRGRYPETLFADQHVAPPPIQEGDMALISAPIDFLGVNYYSRQVIGGDPDNPGTTRTIHPVPGSAHTAMGWEVFPQGLSDLLMRLHRDYAPAALHITENGAAYDDEWDGGDSISDPERRQYLVAHIEAVAQVIAQGAPVQGYFVWSFMDNFEWGEGYSKRFGLVYIDYPTQRRIVKDSGHWYRDLLARALGSPVR